MSESDSDSGDSSAVSEVEIEDGYGDLHKLVLQGFMTAGILNTAGVKTLFQRAHKQLGLNFNENNILELIKETVLSINRKINRYNLTIKLAECEITGLKAYMFAVTVESPLMKNQMHFSKFEVEMFKQCLDLFLRKSEDFTASSVDCINLSQDLVPKGTLAQAESFVEKMVDQHYFIKYSLDESVDMEDYNITLGIRAIRELEPTLMELYADILVICGLCKKTMLHGYKCPGHRCDTYVHMPCCKTYLKTASPDCPKCKKAWKLRKMIKRTQATGADGDNQSGSGGSDSGEEPGDSDLNDGVTLPTPVPPDMEMDVSNAGDDEEDTQLTPAPEEMDTQLTPVDGDNSRFNSDSDTTTEDSE